MRVVEICRQKQLISTTLIILYVLAVTKIGISHKAPFSSFQHNNDFQRSSFSSLMRLTFSLKNVQDTPHLVKTSQSIQVVGGTEASPHQFPFQISIQARNYFGGYDHHCGGVIYNAVHILSAAHCLRGIHFKNLKIVAGEHELFNDAGSEQYRDVLGYVFHPGFDPQTLGNDIAIMTLDFPLSLNDVVQPLALPSTITPYPETARTCGWGKTGYENEQQLKLMYVDLDVFPEDECTQAWPGKISNGMICAGDRKGDEAKGSCNGDSGSALVCSDEKGVYLCGLVSWGAVDCTAPSPTVFTSINTYLDWLTALLPPQE